jgi:predicted metal-dependent hydrolase
MNKLNYAIVKNKNQAQFWGSKAKTEGKLRLILSLLMV